MDFVARLYSKNPDGHLEDMQNEIDGDEIGGVLPNVGDLIVEPGVPEGLSRIEPQNRTVYEVESRYFLPGHSIRNRPSGAATYVALVVKQRTGLESERDLVTVI